MTITPEQLEKLRAPFDLDEIELLPKYTGPRKEVNGRKVPANPKEHCAECGGYHEFPCIHLSYVGHAGVTKRLLDVDPEWSWTPLALTPAGTPLMSDGGMWGKLTVCGVTRIGFGDAQGKTGPNATKELIGDFIRNAAMRFGVGTYLWSKSEAAKAELTRQGADESEPESEHKPSPKADAKTLKAIRAMRKSLGIDDDKYAAQLAAAQGSLIASDAELSQNAAVKLMAAYEERIHALREAERTPAPEPEPEYTEEVPF